MTIVQKRLGILTKYWLGIRGVYRSVANRYKALITTITPIEEHAKLCESIPSASVKEALQELLKTLSLDFFERVNAFFVQKKLQHSNVQKRLYFSKISEFNYDNDISDQLKHLQRTLIRKATTKKSAFPKKLIEDPIPVPSSTESDPKLQLIIPYPEMESIICRKRKAK